MRKILTKFYIWLHELANTLEYNSESVYLSKLIPSIFYKYKKQELDIEIIAKELGMYNSYSHPEGHMLHNALSTLEYNRVLENTSEKDKYGNSKTTKTYKINDYLFYKNVWNKK